MNSPELQFLLAGVRINNSAQRRAELLASLPAVTNAKAIAEIAFQHGVLPLLYARLKETVWAELPPDLKKEIEIAQRKNAVHSLLLTGELVRLVNLLRNHNLFILPYKGPALAVQLYGDVAMRRYGDIDIVIRQSEWAQVNSLLLENNFIAAHELPAAQEHLYQNAYNEHAYLSAQGTYLEVHWAFAEPRFCFPYSIDALCTRLMTLTVAGTEMSVPVPEDLLLILCFHGAKHKWERLGWIADIAQLIAISPHFDWERLMAQAQAFGCVRMLHLSLDLAASLMHAPLPENVQRDIQADKKARSLAAEIAARLQSGAMPEIGMWELILFHLQMRERWRDRFWYCYHLMFRTTPKDWAMLPFVFPASLSILYYPARLVRLLRKYLLGEKV